MANFNVGDRVRVIDQNITGQVVFADDWHIVIEDDDSEFEDNRLEYRASDLELCEAQKVLDFFTTYVIMVTQFDNEVNGDL